MYRADRAEFGDGDRRLGEQLEQERLELVVGTIDLVDQQHRRARAGVLDRAQQRTRHQILGPEEIGLAQLVLGCFRNSDRKQLTWVIPFVQRFRGIDALVALQPDQRCVERSRQRLGGLGLADAGLTLEQQRLRQSHGAEQGGCHALIGEVVAGIELGAQRVDRRNDLGDAHDVRLTRSRPRDPQRTRAGTHCRRTMCARHRDRNAATRRPSPRSCHRPGRSRSPLSVQRRS